MQLSLPRRRRLNFVAIFMFAFRFLSTIDPSRRLMFPLISSTSVQTFSPNRVYYNALLLEQLARPYVGFLQAASATVHWVHPWKR